MKLTSALWDICKDEGTYTYDSDEGGWYDGQQQLYKWNGSAGNEMALVEV